MTTGQFSPLPLVKGSVRPVGPSQSTCNQAAGTAGAKSTWLLNRVVVTSARRALSGVVARVRFCHLTAGCRAYVLLRGAGAVDVFRRDL